MPRPTRSPVLGFNHNVKYRGRIFHVQTEDSGPGNPRIFTHLYFGGTILASKRHEYDPAAPEDLVKALMQSQHKSILKELKSARHDERIVAFFAARGETLEAAAPAGDHGALDLDAAPTEPVRPPLEPVPTPTPTLAPLFADSFEDEPTTPDRPIEGLPAAPAAVPAAPVPTLMPPSITPTPQSPSIYMMSQPAARRRPRVTPAMGAPVVVQRTIAVGGDPARVPQRPRRPAQAFPYVVKEGSHQFVDSNTPPPEALPPPAPLVAPPVTAANAPITTGVRPATAPAEPVVEKSLDEVILAYLAQGVGTEGDGR